MVHGDVIVRTDFSVSATHDTRTDTRFATWIMRLSTSIG